MPATYKFTYFALKARGEPARYLFALADAPYEDCRVKFEDWPAMKPTTPFGGLPLLEVDGKNVLCESHAIDRFLAAELGFNGCTSMEAAEIDMVMGIVSDMFKPVGSVFFSGKRNDAEAYEKLKSEHLDKFGQFLNQRLANSTSGWLVGDSVSVADVVVYSFCVDHACTMLARPDMFDEYSSLKAMFEKFEALPQIKAWVAMRPPSPSWEEMLEGRAKVMKAAEDAAAAKE